MSYIRGRKKLSVIFFSDEDTFVETLECVICVCVCVCVCVYVRAVCVGGGGGGRLSVSGVYFFNEYVFLVIYGLVFPPAVIRLFSPATLSAQ